ncbi:glycosyl transferase family 2 [Arthrobacter livingstonensis]|uniref:Glycosyl transferase family 2 n=1 Tax=Arthrobacter livingstonensis TaxID=670078 RepID=A0A2V5L5E4_9MICC|nr:glycosyltransferase family 2 protein [Arthrobacter livingstonensis]PYI65812.1 glycosyl transferase family 2 [Arthrobacter livingstonensis]
MTYLGQAKAASFEQDHLHEELPHPPVPPLVHRHPSVSLVIPTLNEARNLPWVLRRIPPFVDQVVIVDGRSVDDTVKVARAVRPNVDIVLEPEKGKGAAIRAGFAASTGDLIVMIDADGSMDPGEIGWYTELLSSGFDFVKGSRYLTGGTSDDLTWLRGQGNRALTGLANVACHRHFSDLCYGYVGLRRQVLPLLELASSGFEIETELAVRAALAGLRIAEVPTHELNRLSGTSNLRTFRDGWRVLHTLVKEWYVWDSPTAGAPAESILRVRYHELPVEITRSPDDPAALLAPATGI